MSNDKCQPINVIAAGTPYIYDANATSLYLPRIFSHHLDTGIPLYVKHVNGILSITIEELLIFLEESGAKKGLTKYDSEYSYLWDFSFVSFSFNKNSKTISLNGYLMDQKLIDVFDFIGTNFISKSKKNLVFSIVKSSAGLDIKNLGDGSSSLIKDNYNPEVITELEYVIESFKKDPPPGRICILNGEPGTGKTYLVRSFLSEIDCVYLIVPSNLIASLDSPEFLPLLLRVKESHEKPILLIIEDGDACLVPRKSDNMSTITSLLNLSDGILGSILDIKMIITTNAYIKDLDQAILRPGRLCRNINVGPLEYAQANQVYHRLTNNSNAFLDKKKYYTLAEIYNIVNNKDNLPLPNVTKYNPIGFYS